jgi:hypothetical protein
VTVIFLLPNSEGHYSEWSVKITLILPLARQHVSPRQKDRRAHLCKLRLRALGIHPKPRRGGADPLPSTPRPTLRGLDAVNVWPFNHHEGSRPAPLDPSQPCAVWMRGRGFRAPCTTTRELAAPSPPQTFWSFFYACS